MNLVYKLLQKNISPSRFVGFLVSNFIGLAIIGAGLQFWLDARSIWSREDSFLKSDYLAINKVIDASRTIGGGTTEFSADEIADIEHQAWVKRVGEFRRADFNVHASVALDGGTGRQMSTAMFFESVPEGFLDVDRNSFSWQEGDEEVPIIISKDYLALYNFGFAGAAGLPRLSESLVSGIPLRLTLVSEDGFRRIQMLGRVAGYSNRFNTILVPRTFLDTMNIRLGSNGGRGTPGPDSATAAPSRLIVDVSSPGDAAIAPYLKERGWEVAGDKSASGAAYLLKVVAGTVMAVGVMITLLSALILTLSLSLLMERNRRKLHSLLMLGLPVKAVAKPYWRVTALSGVLAGALAYGTLLLLRSTYIHPLEGLGATPGTTLWSLLIILLLTILIILLNCVAVTRRVRAAWR